jgi:hypothetical protein
MAFASVITVIFAITSSYVALYAFQAQIIGLQRQEAAVAEEREARQMAAASKVTWWIDTHDGTLNVRNGSNGQLFLATFNYTEEWERPASAMLPSIPPCTTLSLPEDNPEMEQLDLPARQPMSLVFEDGAGSWTRSITGLLKRAEADEYATGANGAIQSVALTSKPATYTKIDGCA